MHFTKCNYMSYHLKNKSRNYKQNIHRYQVLCFNSQRLPLKVVPRILETLNKYLLNVNKKIKYSIGEIYFIK